jgi:glycosyltransferase involved in cell wall biosynthesis
MAKPIVSVLIPSYNHAPFLAAALASVQAQTLGDWEVQLLDDGSSDDSVQVAERAAAADPRIRVGRNDHNLGTYGTQERARGLARGKYIAILNSDDVWDPGKLEAQVEVMERDPEASFVFNLGWKIDEHGTVDEEEDVHANWPMEASPDLLPYLLYENRVLASSVLFRADGLKFDESLRYSGDWAALLRMAVRGRPRCVPERLSYWRMHSHNTFRRSVGQVAEEVRVRRAIWDAQGLWLASSSPRKAVLQGLGRNMLNLAALELLCRQRPSAVRHAAMALRLLDRKAIGFRRLAATLVPGGVSRVWPGEDPSRFALTPEDLSPVSFA